MNDQDRAERRWKIAILVLLALVASVLVMYGALYLKRFEIKTVPTSSMAPTMLGEHIIVDCPNCGYEWPVYWYPRSQRNTTADFTCPNCGASFEQTIDPGDVIAGEEIVTLSISDPAVELERWDVGLYRFSREAAGIFAMRLIGLPGEVLEIYDGNIYINGDIARKPRELQEKMWVEVYNSAFVPADGKFPWEFEDESWKTEKGEPGLLLVFKGSQSRSTARFTRKLDSSLSFNGDGFSGRGNWNADAAIEFTFEYPGKGSLGTGIQTGESEGVELVMNLSENGEYSAELVIGGLSEAAISISPGAGGKHKARLSWTDGLVRVELDGEEILSAEHLRENIPEKNPVVYLEAGGNCRFSGIRILKDLYYTKETGQYDRYEIKERHYFFLGDNSERARDCRFTGAVSAEQVVGKAIGKME